MSSSNMSNAVGDAIINSSRIFYQFWSYLMICLGIIGHSLSVYVFTRPTLRSNPCVRYFLAATISGFFVTLVNVPLRLLQAMYNYDAFGYSNLSCKLLTFIVSWSRAQTPWFIALASIDRFLCSSHSVGLRAWSNRRVASYTILCVIIFVGLAYIYVPIQFETTQTLLKCSGNQGYSIFNGIWNLLIFSLGPSLVMLIFGSLTIGHVQQSIKRVTTQDTEIQVQNVSQLTSAQDQLKRQKMIDRQLFQMMIVQCVYFSSMSTPISIWYIYDAVRMNLVIDPIQRAKDNAFILISGAISATGACTAFYLFTLSSELFRRELTHLFHGRCREH